jgi:hypothetical protein
MKKTYLPLENWVKNIFIVELMNKNLCLLNIKKIFFLESEEKLSNSFEEFVEESMDENLISLEELGKEYLLKN